MLALSSDQNHCRIKAWRSWQLPELTQCRTHIILLHRTVIFSNPNNPDRGVETCHNLICLSPDARDYWTRTQFALKPIRLSDDKRRLDVEFHWLPKYNYSSEVDISALPKSSRKFGWGG